MFIGPSKLRSLRHSLRYHRVVPACTPAFAAAALGNNSATPLLARYHKFELPHTVHINNSLRKARRDTMASLIFAGNLPSFFLSNKIRFFFFFNFYRNMIGTIQRLHFAQYIVNNVMYIIGFFGCEKRNAIFLWLSGEMHIYFFRTSGKCFIGIILLEFITCRWKSVLRIIGFIFPIKRNALQQEHSDLLYWNKDKFLYFCK